ncbi:RNA 2',3'-cyclic phosphodiesterase [Pedococcus sp. 5OH_020]|uniref:RNA 2',3'-cyclic phosphodiesterase n=1 Tax=Pedococcus sp. 5OH_020 TaxID=2989814 RepID=UPI0022E9FF0B|nr:RNA 2',3'-cyclic phosphodiesterase [Pedococcus sp. 5OH_020]
MRMFAALVPPADALDDLEAFLEPRRDAGPDLRWTDSSLWHVTLAFMAQVPDGAVEDVLEGVAGAVAGREPAVLQCKGGGAFPSPYEARVTWVGVQGDSESLQSLAALSRAVRLACARAGGAPAGGPFVPHLTLARSRRPFEATRWLRVLESYEGPDWDASEVTLFASHTRPGHGRARYEPMAVLELGASKH